MANFNADPSNCGVKHLNYLSYDPKVNVHSFLTEYRRFERQYNIIVFSDNVNSGKAGNLAKYINEQKLGKVIASEKVNNPTHGTHTTPWLIQMFLWHPDYEALAVWEQENKEKAEEWAVSVKPTPPEVTPVPTRTGANFSFKMFRPGQVFIDDLVVYGTTTGRLDLETNPAPVEQPKQPKKPFRPFLRFKTAPKNPKQGD